MPGPYNTWDKGGSNQVQPTPRAITAHASRPSASPLPTRHPAIVAEWARPWRAQRGCSVEVETSLLGEPCQGA